MHHIHAHHPYALDTAHGTQAVMVRVHIILSSQTLLTPTCKVTRYYRAGPAPGMTGIPVIPVMPDLPGESRIPGILLLTGITDDKQNKK